MRVENQGPGPSKDHVLQIKQGGTSGATNEQALRNLGAIAVEEINTANGIAGYEFGTGRVPESILPDIAGGNNTPTIEGPRSLTLGESAILKITNFDSFTNYQVTYQGFTGERDGDTILVTATNYGDDGGVVVNGSVFGINVTIANPPLLGEVVFRHTTPDAVTDIKVSDSIDRILIARSVKEFVGSLNAGEVNLFQRNADIDLTSQHVLSPAILDTVITYTGQGAKKFTANNQVTNRTGNGSITFTGAGNILIEATGDMITTPAVPPQGLPQYPNGLPPYIAGQPGSSSGSWGEYNIQGYNVNGPISGTHAGVAPPPISTTGSPSLPASPYDGQSLVRSMVKIHEFGGGATYPYPLYYGRTTWTSTLRYTVTTSPGTPGQGHPSYPSGLPPYNPGSPGSSGPATLTFTSSTFQITGTSINQTAYPFKNYRLGQATTMAENGTYASGQTLETTERLGLGGEVIIIHNDGTRKKQHITLAYSAPHPRFGAAVKLKSDASHLLIGAPGVNRVYLYRNVANNFEAPAITTPAGLVASARFGERIDANDSFSRIYVHAPGEGVAGAVYIYSLVSSALTFVEKITIPALPSGFVISSLMRAATVVSKVFFNAYSASTNTYTVIELTKIGSVWSLTKTFTTPNPGVPDLFGQYFNVSEDGRVVVISSVGTPSMKGVINIWINVDGVWVFFDSAIDDEGEFGDTFGKYIALASDGKNGVTIHKTPTGDDIIYLR